MKNLFSAFTGTVVDNFDEIGVNIRLKNQLYITTQSYFGYQNSVFVARYHVTTYREDGNGTFRASNSSYSEPYLFYYPVKGRHFFREK